MQTKNIMAIDLRDRLDVSSAIHRLQEVMEENGWIVKPIDAPDFGSEIERDSVLPMIFCPHCGSELPDWVKENPPSSVIKCERCQKENDPLPPIYEKTGLALKETAGKPRWDLLPYGALEEVVKVRTWAVATKYPEKHNWRKGLPWSEAFNSAQRHLKEWHEGEDINPESRLSHLAHAAWWCLALIEYASTHPELDDRWKGDGK